MSALHRIVLCLMLATGMTRCSRLFKSKVKIRGQIVAVFRLNLTANVAKLFKYRIRHRWRPQGIQLVLQSKIRTTRVHPTVDKPVAIHVRLQYASNSESAGVVHRAAPQWPRVMCPVSQIRASTIAISTRRQRYPHRGFHPELGCWQTLQVKFRILFAGIELLDRAMFNAKLDIVFATLEDVRPNDS